MRAFALSDYDYALETERIAQEPLPERDRSRLMVVDRAAGRCLHRRFSEISEFLREGDLLVLNDTRVIPARLRAVKETAGGLEIFLLRELAPSRWEALIRGKVREGTSVILEGGVRGVVEETRSRGPRVIRFPQDWSAAAHLSEHGSMPLPPYIRRNGDAGLSELDRERYQTVYAREPGAVAAPTAGLHFTEALLQRIRASGVEIVFVTLHVGYGTFQPVTAGDIRRHRMESEPYRIGEDTATAVNRAVREGRRVIAVGSTSCRALESAAGPGGELHRPSGNTDLFIYPGYRFRVVGGLVTNFHLPRSTLLILVAAFGGKALMDRAYREARERRYRFYSYGDAMLIL